MIQDPSGAQGRRRVIRAPNHLGDVVMALPALLADGGDIVVRDWLAPLVAMASPAGRVVPLAPGWAGWRAVMSSLRSGGYREGVLLSPAFSAALLFRLGGVGRLRGTATDGRSLLLGDRVPRSRLGGYHRINQYRLLLGQDPGVEPEPAGLTPPEEQLSRWQARLLPTEGPVVGIFPGSNAPARRWPVERFAALAEGLAAWGVRVVVMGGRSDMARTAEVAAAAPGAIDAGGDTDLPGLAALLACCRVVVSNDTGPLHLAASVGTATVSVWGPSDPAEVAPRGERHARVSGTPLPCQPCFKNRCPRNGRGTMLDNAHEECMNLIPDDAVLTAVKTILEGSRR